MFFCSESLSDAGESTANNGTPVQVKEEEEEVKEQPAAKRKRGQNKSQTKIEEMPKEETKNEGTVDLIFIYVVYAVTVWSEIGC